MCYGVAIEMLILAIEIQSILIFDPTSCYTYCLNLNGSGPPPCLYVKAVLAKSFYFNAGKIVLWLLLLGVLIHLFKPILL